MLMSYHWPGNVRELENVLERAVLVCDGQVIHAHHLPPSLQTAESSGTVTRVSLSDAVDAYEKDLIQDALKTTRGNRAKAARLLDTTERVLNYKVRNLGSTTSASRSNSVGMETGRDLIERRAKRSRSGVRRPRHRRDDGDHRRVSRDRSTLMGHRLHTEEVVMQTKSADGWAYFQAKNNRSHMYSQRREAGRADRRARGAAPVVADWTKKATEERQQADEIRVDTEKLDHETEADRPPRDLLRPSGDLPRGRHRPAARSRS